jgi:hypothetical protein
MPPRLECALSATEVQSSQNPDFVYTRIDEHYFLWRTLRPIRRPDKAIWAREDRCQALEHAAQAVDS